VNAIVFDGCTLGLAIPDGNWACGLGLEHDLSDRVADEFRDTAPRARRGHAQCVEFFLAEVNLSLYHVCHFTRAADVRQLDIWMKKLLTWGTYCMVGRLFSLRRGHRTARQLRGLFRLGTHLVVGLCAVHVSAFRRQNADGRATG